MDRRHKYSGNFEKPNIRTQVWYLYSSIYLNVRKILNLIYLLFDVELRWFEAIEGIHRNQLSLWGCWHPKSEYKIIHH